MNHSKVVSRDEWLAARKQHLKKEKEFTRLRDAAGRAFYNYEYANPWLEDRSGDSVFFKDDAGQIFHTYSTYGRGGEEFLGA